MSSILYKPDTYRFIVTGLDLNSPVDAMKPSKLPYLKNVRSYQFGRLEPRVGLTAIGTVVGAQTPVHSCRRLNYPINGTWTRVIGTGTHLAHGQGSFTDDDSGYSGNPLSLIPMAPVQSPEPWMYVADSSRMRKLDITGRVHQIGLPPPPNPPTATLATPLNKVIQNTEATTDWSNAGTAGAVALLTYRYTTTISYIRYDVGSTGWATVVPAAMTSIGPGAHIEFVTANTEQQVIQDVYPACSTTTIGSILYDSGNSGACSIQLATASDNLEVGSLIYIASAEYCRVTAVIVGPDGVQSIRTSTSSTRAAGNTVVGAACFRVNCFNAHSASETIRANGLTSAITAGTATLKYTGATDLTSISTGYPSHADDDIHVSLRFSDLTAFTEGKIYFDCDASTNDFTKNYYYYAFRPSDLVPSLANTDTTAATRTDAVNQNTVDNTPPGSSPSPGSGDGTGNPPVYNPGDPVPITPGSRLSPTVYRGLMDHSTRDATGTRGGGAGRGRSVGDSTGDLINRQWKAPRYSLMAVAGQTATGATQWWELRFKFSDLVRVGTEESRGLATIAAFGLTIVATKAFTLDMSSWWIGGGFGPDSGATDEGYMYRYRGRVSLTGARGNYSPASRGPVRARRQAISLSLPQHTSTECDMLDIERFGGTLAEWHYIGSTPNGASSTFSDVYSDSEVATSPSEGNTNYQPWPIVGIPVSGTASTVAGTLVKDSGTNFSTSWAPGVTIHVNGIPHTIYRVLTTSLLELVESAGTATNATWNINAPLLMGQPLQVMFGPFEGFVFACGDPKNAGVLYASKGNDPDSTMEDHKWYVTSPSEPLMNGCVYNGRAYVWSSERMFQILPAFNTTDIFSIIEVPNGKGLFSPWALCVGPKIWFLGRDSIYQTMGEGPQSITDADLFPIFPNEGNLGMAVNGIYAPNIVAAQSANLRLAYYDDFLYFDYPDTQGTRCTLVYSTDPTREGWWFDITTPGAIFHYGDEGKNVHALFAGSTDGTNGKLYQCTGTDDAGTAIAFAARTPSLTQGDRRSLKLYGDYIVDSNTNGQNVTLQIGYNAWTSLNAAQTLTQAGRDIQTFDLNSGLGDQNHDIALLMSGNASGGYPLLYLWEPSYIAYPQTSLTRQTDWEDDGYPGAKWLQGVEIQADTGNVAKTVQVQGDGGTVIATLTITDNGRILAPYSWVGAFTHMMRLVPTDANAWRIFGWRWIWEPAPPLTDTWETPDSTWGMTGFWHIRDGYIAHVSTANLTLTVTLDGAASQTYTIVHNSGAYKKTYLPFTAAKSKYRRFKLTSSAGFRLYKMDCELFAKPWGIDTAYVPLKPFGEESVVSGARV